MKNKFKAHAPILSVVLSLLAVGYSFAANVVVIPLAADNPKGAVIAFNSQECPAGWLHYQKSEGRFVLGTVPNGGTGYEGGQAYHNHRWTFWSALNTYWRSYNDTGNLVTIMNWTDGMNSDGSGHYPLSIDTPSSSRSFYTDQKSNYPPYVQLLYCEKV